MENPRKGTKFRANIARFTRILFSSADTFAAASADAAHHAQRGADSRQNTDQRLKNHLPSVSFAHRSISG